QNVSRLAMQLATGKRAACGASGRELGDQQGWASRAGWRRPIRTGYSSGPKSGFCPTAGASLLTLVEGPGRRRGPEANSLAEVFEGEEVPLQYVELGLIVAFFLGGFYLLGWLTWDSRRR